MKKLVIVFVILFLSAFYFIGCGSTILNFNSIMFLDNEILVHKNDHLDLFDLKFKTEPIVDKMEYFDFGIDEKYISFKDDKFYFKNVGETVLNVYAMGANNEVISSNIKINIVDNVEVTKFEMIENVVYLDCGEIYSLKNNIAINPISVESEINFVCDDNTKINDENLFCSNVPGEFLIRASVRKAINNTDEENVSYKIIVQNNVYVEEIKLNNSATFKVYENSEGFINFGIVPMDANVFDIESSSENLCVSKNGKFVAKSAMNDVELIVKYKTSKFAKIISKSFRVDIIESVNVKDCKLVDNHNNKIESVVADEKVSINLELEITNMQLLNNIEFSDVFNVFDVEYKNNKLKAKVSFKNAKDDRNLKLSHIDSFGNARATLIDLNDIKVYEKDEIKLVVSGNATNLKLDENTGEYLLFKLNNEYYSDVCDLVNYSFKIIVFNSDDVLNVSDIIADNFNVDDGWLYAKEIGCSHIKVLVCGCEFEIKIKVLEVPVLDFSVVVLNSELLLNSDDKFQTSFKIESEQYYSTLFEKMEVICNIKDSLAVDLKNKTITIKDVKSDECNVSFKIGSITKVVKIKTGYSLTDVKVSVDDIGLMKDNVISNFNVMEIVFYSLNFYSNSTLLLNYEFDVKIEVLNKDMSVSDSAYVSNYSASGLNYFSVSKVGNYLLKISFGNGLNYKIYEIRVD